MPANEMSKSIWIRTNWLQSDTSHGTSGEKAGWKNWTHHRRLCHSLRLPRKRCLRWCCPRRPLSTVPANAVRFARSAGRCWRDRCQTSRDSARGCGRWARLAAIAPSTCPTRCRRARLHPFRRAICNWQLNYTSQRSLFSLIISSVFPIISYNKITTRP